MYTSAAPQPAPAPAGRPWGRLWDQDPQRTVAGAPRAGLAGSCSPGGAAHGGKGPGWGPHTATAETERSGQNRQTGGSCRQEALEQRIWGNKLPHLLKTMAPGLKNPIKTITHILSAASERKDHSLMRVRKPLDWAKGSRGPSGRMWPTSSGGKWARAYSSRDTRLRLSGSPGGFRLLPRSVNTGWKIAPFLLVSASSMS